MTAISYYDVAVWNNLTRQWVAKGMRELDESTARRNMTRLAARSDGYARFSIVRTYKNGKIRKVLES